MFQPGKEKTGGRKKGVENKKTAVFKQRIEFTLSILDESLESDLKALKPRERVNLWASLQEFIRPKLARTEIEQEDKIINIHIVRDSAD